MPVMDEFREEREKIKTASGKEKWKYFKDYYLVWTLIGLGIAVAAAAFLYSVLTRKDDALYVSLVNFVPQEGAEVAVKEAFEEAALEDTKHWQITLDTSSFIVAGTLTDEEGTDAEAALENAEDPSITDVLKYGYEDEQKIATLAMTGTMDLMLTGEDVLEKYAAQGYFVPLAEVLDAEEFVAYEEAERLVYYEGSAVGVRMDGAALLERYYYYDGEGEPSLCAGFVGGGQHSALAAEFLRFLEAGG